MILKNETLAIDKIRDMVNWFNWQNEGFAQRFKTIKQLERVYDFAKKNGFEFLDDLSQYEDEEAKLIVNFFKTLK